MVRLTVKRRSLSSEERFESVKYRMDLLKKIQIEVLKKEVTLWEEWRSLMKEDKGRRRL